MLPQIEFYDLLSHLKRVRKAGNGYSAQCPAHDDAHNSLHLTDGSDCILLNCFAGCPPEKIVAALGLNLRNLFHSAKGDHRPHDEHKIVAVYDYRDAGGKMLYQKVRYEPKSFAFRRPDSKGGWAWNLDGLSPVLYRLPEILPARSVVIVEGERDADTAKKLGFVATTSGATGSWRKEFAEVLGGKRIAIIADADDPGRRHARQVAVALVGVAEAVKIRELPDAKDLSEWVERGGTRERLLELVKAAPTLTAADVTSLAETDAELAGATQEAALEEKSPAKSSQADRLIALASTEEVELFHTAEGEAYATVLVNEHPETWPIKSQGFRRWLLWKYFRAEQRGPSTQALEVARNTIAAKAQYDGAERPVFVRVAGLDNTIYLDLANHEWQAVEITPSGWRVIDNPPVRFVRKRGMLPLPVPVLGGSLSELKKFVNVGSESDWVLLAAALIAALRPKGPYPTLVLHGEQGNAKSTTEEVLRALVDPNTAPIRAEPKEPRDLMIAASNGWVVAFDNLSHLSPWLSDSLCRLATGGGFATRELWTDGEEAIFDAMRPVILNGIEELTTRGDLLDRSVILYLPNIPESKRRPESEFWEEFEERRPRILGALLDAVSTALRNLPNTKLDRLPRMADFALWATAAEESIGEKGAFLKAYQGNKADANQLALEGSAVACAVEDLIVEQGQFQGTCSELLEVLSARIGEEKRKDRNWPKSPQSLSNRLRRIAPNLQAAGISVEQWRDPDRTRRRMILLEKLGETSSTSSVSSEALPFQHEQRTVVDELPVSQPETSSIPNQLKSKALDDVDDGGRTFPAFSNSEERESWEL